MYEYTDSRLKRLRRSITRKFDKLKLLPFDELNVTQTVTEIFEYVAKQSKRCFEDILEYYYFYGYDTAPAGEKKEKGIRDNLKAGADKKTQKKLEKLLDKILEEYDPVTKYRFSPELDRKKDRLIEAILSSGQTTEIPKTGTRTAKQTAASAAKEIDKALRYLVLQLTEYSIKSTDRAVLQGYEDAGVRFVQWVAQEDEKVCVTCHRYNGQIFEISAAPSKPHYNCRCYLKFVTRSE